MPGRITNYLNAMQKVNERTAGKGVVTETLLVHYMRVGSPESVALFKSSRKYQKGFLPVYSIIVFHSNKRGDFTSVLSTIEREEANKAFEIVKGGVDMKKAKLIARVGDIKVFDIGRFLLIRDDKKDGAWLAQDTEQAFYYIYCIRKNLYSV